MQPQERGGGRRGRGPPAQAAALSLRHSPAQPWPSGRSAARRRRRRRRRRRGRRRGRSERPPPRVSGWGGSGGRTCAGQGAVPDRAALSGLARAPPRAPPGSLPGSRAPRPLPRELRPPRARALQGAEVAAPRSPGLAQPRPKSHTDSSAQFLLPQSPPCPCGLCSSGWA